MLFFQFFFFWFDILKLKRSNNNTVQKKINFYLLSFSMMVSRTDNLFWQLPFFPFTLLFLDFPFHVYSILYSIHFFLHGIWNFKKEIVRQRMLTLISRFFLSLPLFISSFPSSFYSHKYPLTLLYNQSIELSLKVLVCLAIKTDFSLFL